MNLKQLRLKRGLTQEQAVKQIGYPGLDQGKLSSIERGLFPADGHLAAAIARFYGVSIERAWPEVFATKQS